MPDGRGGRGEPEAAAELGAPVAWRMPTASELDTIPPEMQRLFVVETSEDLHDLRTLLLQYEEQQDNHGSLLAMGRVSHKIKGAAGTLGFDVLASLAFTFEDLLTALQTRQVAPGPHAVSILVRGLALMQAAVDAANSDHDPDPSLIARAQDLRDEFLARRYTHPPLPRVADFNDTSVRAGLNDSGARTPTTHDGESYLRVDVRRLEEPLAAYGAYSLPATGRRAGRPPQSHAARRHADSPGAAQYADAAPTARSPPASVSARQAHHILRAWRIDRDRPQHQRAANRAAHSARAQRFGPWHRATGGAAGAGQAGRGSDLAARVLGRQ